MDSFVIKSYLYLNDEKKVFCLVNENLDEIKIPRIAKFSDDESQMNKNLIGLLGQDDSLRIHRHEYEVNNIDLIYKYFVVNRNINSSEMALIYNIVKDYDLIPQFYSIDEIIDAIDNRDIYLEMDNDMPKVLRKVNSMLRYEK